MNTIFLLPKKLLFFCCMLSFCLLAGRAEANPSYIAEIVGAGKSVSNVVIADPIGGGQNAAMLQKYISSNLGLLPFINMVPGNSIPGGAALSGASSDGIDFKRFVMAGVNLLVTTKWVSDSQVELRAFEVAQGRRLVGNSYTVQGGKDSVYDVADKFCGDLLEVVIGNGSFFRSDMAFSKTAGAKKRDIWAVKPNGRYLRRLTDIPGEALSPTWSPNGRYVLFSHIDYRSHALGVWDSATKNTRRIRFPGNTVIGPCYFPNSSSIAVGLSDGRNPSIFMLNGNFEKQAKLDESPAIDVSPSIDASGTKMAFTSSRLGGPQIFLKDLRTGSVARVSMTGSYNTDPSISPDGTMVAFASRTPQGHRIFVRDLVTGQERQVSFGPGSDEEPAFAPDNYFIAFMSSRSGQRGIYLTTKDGAGPTKLPTGAGDAGFPAWGNAR